MLEEVRADLILVVEDVRETSDGIERLLKADGYRVSFGKGRTRRKRECQAEAARCNTNDLDGIIR